MRTLNEIGLAYARYGAEILGRGKGSFRRFRFGLFRIQIKRRTRFWEERKVVAAANYKRHLLANMPS